MKEKKKKNQYPMCFLTKNMVSLLIVPGSKVKFDFPTKPR